MRRVLLVVHAGRPAAVVVANRFADALRAAGMMVLVPADETSQIEGLGEVVPADELAGADCEVVVVIGGDGTILRAAEYAHASGTPLLGVNLGHVGFLAEAERENIGVVVDAVVNRTWTVEERLALHIDVVSQGELIATTWALNEASVEKAARDRMLEVNVEIDGHPLSRWGCDGVVCATPTGSTAYAFSAGGPIVWPEVQALLLVPISAHALFSRSVVVAPTSSMLIRLSPQSPGAVLWADGRRTFELPAGAEVTVRRHSDVVRFARLHQAPFTDRLVAKFSLPVDGWRRDYEESAGGEQE